MNPFERSQQLLSQTAGSRGGHRHVHFVAYPNDWPFRDVLPFARSRAHDGLVDSLPSAATGGGRA